MMSGGSTKHNTAGGKTKGGRGKIKMRIGSSGALVPDEPDDVLLEKLAFQLESKRPGKMFLNSVAVMSSHFFSISEVFVKL